MADTPVQASKSEKVVIREGVLPSSNLKVPMPPVQAPKPAPAKK